MPPDLDELIQHSPDWLQERVRRISDLTQLASGEFVLYWMRTSIRTDENPALDFAIELSNNLGVPLLVYQGLSEKYPYASDRHHTFVIQAARDVQSEFAAKRIPYAFHLEREGNRGPHLATLANRSAAVVTEDFPCEPIRSWTELLARKASVPVVAVDTSCIVPMQLVGKAHTRAFAFRKATKKLYAERLTRAYPGSSDLVNTTSSFDLPFEPVDFDRHSIPDLVGQCSIDHTIGPVPHTVGGSVAGYQRWQTFRDKRLASYDKRRNNPLQDGVSRMSAYLHYGMVSPLRIAREAADHRSSGAEKYLDELLIWRELAYTFCFYERHHSRLSALPDWARDTLADHESDARPELYSWEDLARANTYDDLWNAAQQSLLKHGELHNNVRMTWGKAILNWTPTAKQALATIIDLNHRYALDGRDPASYGGILWCLGQFDRPFPPERPIIGTVRDRSTETHAERLKVMAYRRITSRPLNGSMPTVAIIGAGLSGLTCARTLHDHGFAVSVFEKSRGPGGRMATRRTETELQFDHGAQYFTARDRRFRRYVDSWQHNGFVERWSGRIAVLNKGQVVDEKSGTDRFVGVPGMNAICQHLSADLTVHYQAEVDSLHQLDDQWQLIDSTQTNLGQFDAVIVSSPAPQTATLLSEVAPKLASEAARVAMSPCWAAMLKLSADFQLPYDAAFVHDSPISWFARNASKPGRDEQDNTFVLHASPEWSAANLELDREQAAEMLVDHFWQAAGVEAHPVEFFVGHRWRYALPTNPAADRCLFDSELRLGACGDWCGGPRVEGAFLSGAAAAGRVMGLLTDQPAIAATPDARQQKLFAT